MRAKLKSVFALAAIICLALAAWWFWPDDERSEPILRWQDPATGIIFLVTEKPGAMVHTWTHLWVTKDDHVERVQLDDDAYFGRAAFVRLDDWLLVLNDEFVMGGYQYSTHTLYGEYSWSKLPFTVRSNAGKVVAERRIRDRGATPVQFPIIHEQATFPAPKPALPLLPASGPRPA